MDKRVVVTGATGHIGNVLVRTLLERGFRVRALLLSGDPAPSLEGVAVDRVSGDILDQASLDRAFSGAEIVFHLAAMIAISPGHYDRMEQVNVTGTANVIAACQRAHVRRLVYVSSIHALRAPASGGVVDERSPFDPETGRTYDRTKAIASLKVIDAVHRGLDAVIVCPTGVIGPYDFVPSDIGQLILDLLDRKIHIALNGSYDFVDVRDVCDGMCAAAEHGRTGEVYLLSGERLTVADIFATIGEAGNVPVPHRILPMWIAAWAARLTPLYYALRKTRPIFTPYALKTLAVGPQVSKAKARAELHFNPRPVRTSIRDAVHWMQKHRVLISRK